MKFKLIDDEFEEDGLKKYCFKCVQVHQMIYKIFSFIYDTKYLK